MSEYSGLVHMINTSLMLVINCHENNFLLDLGYKYTRRDKLGLEEKARCYSGFSLIVTYASKIPLLIANLANSAELETFNFCLILV
jgi:hypothetical protein